MKQVLSKFRQSFVRDLQGVTAYRSCPPTLAQVWLWASPARSRDIVLIRKAAEIWTNSWAVVFKEAALRRSASRQFVAVKDRLDYLETAWPADGVGSCRRQDMERTALCEHRPGV